MTTLPQRPPGQREAYGPQTWALIREAYLAGTPAPHLSRTFGPHVDTIRKRAVREGWTRSAHAASQERTRLLAPALVATDEPLAPSTTPVALLEAAVAQAAAHLAAGRDAQADAAIRRGETLARLAETADRLKPKSLDDLKAAGSEVYARIVELAELSARKALTDPHGLPHLLCDWAYRWRAETFGPECAASDKANRAAAADYRR